MLLLIPNFSHQIHATDIFYLAFCCISSLKVHCILSCQEVVQLSRLVPNQLCWVFNPVSASDAIFNITHCFGYCSKSFSHTQQPVERIKKLLTNTKLNTRYSWWGICLPTSLQQYIMAVSLGWKQRETSGYKSSFKIGENAVNSREGQCGGITAPLLYNATIPTTLINNHDLVVKRKKQPYSLTRLRSGAGGGRTSRTNSQP